MNNKIVFGDIKLQGRFTWKKQKMVKVSKESAVTEDAKWSKWISFNETDMVGAPKYGNSNNS